jgi:hypothetical protein
VEWYLQGKLMNSERSLSQYHYVHHNTTWIDPGANPGLRDEAHTQHSHSCWNQQCRWRQYVPLKRWYLRRSPHDVIIRRTSTIVKTYGFKPYWFNYFQNNLG